MGILPAHFKNAEQIRYVPPIYEYYEDDDGCEQEECVNEFECTYKHDLVTQVIKTQQPIYYFRRTREKASRDARSINNYRDIRGFKYGRRVLIIPSSLSEKITKNVVKELKI